MKILEDNGDQIGLGEIFYGPSLALNYNDPTVDPRTPDIIVNPNVGVVYTGSSKKMSEHGGFAHDDTNVMLLLSNPRFSARTVFAEVGTAQVAPTILRALDISPSRLDAYESSSMTFVSSWANPHCARHLLAAPRVNHTDVRLAEW